MTLALVDLVNLAAREVGETFRDGAGTVADFYREALDGLPDGPPVVSLARGVAQQACRRYADNPDGMPGPIAAGFESVCRPYLDSIGYGAPPVIDTPFRGGQCPGVNYRVTWTWTAPGFTSGVQTADRTGPLSFDRSGTGSLDCGSSGLTYNVLVMREGTGNNPVSLFAGCGAELASFDVQRLDGQPDNCGSPVPEYKPPGAPATPDPPGPTPFSPGPNIDVDIDLTIGPTGDITFNIGTGPITISPFGGGGGDGGEDGSGAPGSGLPPGDVGAPAAPVPTDPAGKASGCAPPNSVLVGVKVTILAAPQFSSEYDPLVRRGVCYVYMGTSTLLALVPEGVAMRSGQMFFAPLDNLTCWEVNANSGYVLQVIPYYRALEPEEV